MMTTFMDIAHQYNNTKFHCIAQYLQWLIMITNAWFDLKLNKYDTFWNFEGICWYFLISKWCFRFEFNMDEFVDYFFCNQWNKCWNEIATSLKINLAKMNKTLHKSAIVLGIVLQLGGDRWLITLIVVLMFYFINKNNFIVTIAWRQQWLITTKMTG